MKIRELIESLSKLDTEQEILIYERVMDDSGHNIDGGYYEIDSIEQWSDNPECSNHYTIYGGKLISG